MPRELEDFLDFLGKLRRFSCGLNPWVEPPAALLGDEGNLPGVKSYFLDLYREKRLVSRSLKVVLVGREGTGKTRCTPLTIWTTNMLPTFDHVSRIFLNA